MWVVRTADLKEVVEEYISAYSIEELGRRIERVLDRKVKGKKVYHWEKRTILRVVFSIRRVDWTYTTLWRADIICTAIHCPHYLAEGGRLEVLDIDLHTGLPVSSRWAIQRGKQNLVKRRNRAEKKQDEKKTPANQKKRVSQAG